MLPLASELWLRPVRLALRRARWRYFASGETRIVYMGGRLGIHSCSMPDGTKSIECNKEMAANATAHGVPWGVIEGFGDYTNPTNMVWLGAEDAECWSSIKWSPKDSSNMGLACWMWSNLKTDKRKPAAVTAKNANDVLCRMNAGTSRIYVSTGSSNQGFSDSVPQSLRTCCSKS